MQKASTSERRPVVAHPGSGLSLPRVQPEMELGWTAAASAAAGVAVGGGRGRASLPTLLSGLRLAKERKREAESGKTG